MHTALNGWCTARRFQTTGACSFGCGAGADSVEHYAHCPCYHDQRQRLLGLGSPAAGHRLEDFLGIGPSTALPHAGASTLSAPDVEVLRAIGIYAAYRAHLAVRHGLHTVGEFAEAYRGYVRDATRGHHHSAALVASTWRRTST